MKLKAIFKRVEDNKRFLIIDEKEQNRPKVENIPVLSFFTGAGFLDIGFERAGFEIIWCNEYYRPFIQAFIHAMRELKKKTYKILIYLLIAVPLEVKHFKGVINFQSLTRSVGQQYSHFSSIVNHLHQK